MAEIKSVDHKYAQLPTIFARVAESGLKPRFESPHWDFPQMSSAALGIGVGSFWKSSFTFWRPMKDCRIAKLWLWTLVVGHTATI